MKKRIMHAAHCLSLLYFVENDGTRFHAESDTSWLLVRLSSTPRFLADCGAQEFVVFVLVFSVVYVSLPSCLSWGVRLGKINAYGHS